MVTDEAACTHVLETIGQIGNKWTMLVLGRLRGGPMLTLRGLERDGLVTRTSRPPRVEYALTELGTSMFDSVAGWAINHSEDVVTNRAAYDSSVDQEH
ncbi:winged helix-turn-helix transcriptional regulator [Cryptosporangium sp. NPDC048952]|uniref:winged helix-turn-helix transcriptional regulator n=1 Tax=Cryptosporangium sp. NPDC048952 TaxID=3363961 RepID=UPI00370FCC24